ncbi:MAG: hypothetical protein ACK4UJ_12205 [Leptonema sp. (in: bacteria)]
MFPINYFEKLNIFKLDEKIKFANWFYENYDFFSVQDIYTWLWLGEFGYSELPKNDLISLKEEIRLARINPPKIKKIWEPLGLSKKFVKINLDLYYEAGYPIKKILQFTIETQEIAKLDRMTFKNNWNLMKIQYDLTKQITLQDFHIFEEKVPFHMTPFLNFTEEFFKEFGFYFKIAPLESFFRSFPECSSSYPEIFIDVLRFPSEMEVS